MQRTASLAFALSALTLACSSGSGAGGGSASGGELPCDVDAILQSHCQSCHGKDPQFGAPMPLVTRDDLLAKAVSDPSKKVYELVGTRIHDDAAPMPQPPNARLSSKDTAALDAWIDGGAPAGKGSCGGTGGAGGGTTLSCTPDLPLIPAAKYTMPADTNDAYICYGIDVTEAQKRHITAFAPKIDNAKIVHHMVLFETAKAVPAAPTPCDIGGAKGWRIVSVWAPGNDGFELPPEAGLPLEGTTHYALQVHYNNLGHLAGQTDGSGFELCTTGELRPNDADVLAFGTFSFEIPAHGSLDVTCDFAVPPGTPETHVVGAMPHMHKLGKAISTVNRPGGTGAPVDLGKRDPWDFNTQYWTNLDEVVKGGDTVSTRCAWANDGSSPVIWGENTEDEMCFSFTMYYPKISAAGWQWGTPSFLSKCAPTP